MKQTDSIHWLLLLCFVTYYAGPATAVNNNLKTETIIEKELTTENFHGRYLVRYIATDKTAPGDTLLYTIGFKSTGDEAENDLYISRPIPDHAVYIPGSATGQHCSISFSLDQGKTYFPVHQLRVTGAAGTTRPASPSEYTYIRWRCQNTIQPKKRRSVTFKVKVM